MANSLKILDDGIIILESQANIFATNAVQRTGRA